MKYMLHTWFNVDCNYFSLWYGICGICWGKVILHLSTPAKEAWRLWCGLQIVLLAFWFGRQLIHHVTWLVSRIQLRWNAADWLWKLTIEFISTDKHQQVKLRLDIFFYGFWGKRSSFRRYHRWQKNNTLTLRSTQCILRHNWGILGSRVDE